ncbi:MAG: hypothetical protein C5B48_12220 [Candidatus Rokuibacteriota bacterium]|nr:MAG: hypothetical protein C5B48_12220 [Candidatus Rokubacteria bacterium]
MREKLRAALGSAGLVVAPLGRLGRPADTVRILYYHSISDDPVRSSVSPSAFRGQIEHLLQRGYCLLSLSEATRRLSSGTARPQRSVVITLDDGFRDNYEQAFPTLQQLGAPATIFLTVSYIGTDHLPTLTNTAFVPRPLTWEHVREMHASGIEFGSHTLTHPMLSRVPLDVARREIADSRHALEDKLGTPAPFFCYPRGDFNEAVRRIVGEEGYAAACTTIPGLNDRQTDRYALRRTYVSRRDTAAEFAKKVAGGYDLLQQAARALNRLRSRRGPAGR